MAVERADVSAMAPLAAAPERLENRRMMRVARGAATTKVRDR